MLFNERCPLQMENFTGKESNGIVQTKPNSPKLKKYSNLLSFLSPAFYMKRHFYLCVLFFKGMLLYDLELCLLKINVKISYYDTINVIKLDSFCFTISSIQYRGDSKQISDSVILFFYCFIKYHRQIFIGKKEPHDKLKSHLIL